MSMHTWAQIAGWVAFGLNIWGNLALAKKSTGGWLIRLACNAGFVVYSVSFDLWPLLANHVVFAFINVYGWREWRKIKFFCECGQEYDPAKLPMNCICELPLRLHIPKEHADPYTRRSRR